MARPIRETPILYGDAARRFEERMRIKRHDDPEKRKRRLENYETVFFNCKKTKNDGCLFVISRIVSIFAL